MDFSIGMFTCLLVSCFMFTLKILILNQIIYTENKLLCQSFSRIVSNDSEKRNITREQHHGRPDDLHC